MISTLVDIQGARPPLPPEDFKQESIDKLFHDRQTVERLLNTTWQRRMVTENFLANDTPDIYLASIPQPVAAHLFSLDEIENGKVVEGGALDQLLEEAKKPGNRDALVEKYLLGKIQSEYPDIHQVTLGSLPAEVFARPDDEASLFKALQLTTGDKRNTPIDDFLLSGEITDDAYRPFLETILEAEWNHLTAKIGLEVLSSPQIAEEYYHTWIKEQKNSPDRIVFTPTYREAARECHAYMRRNGKNRTIARSAAYGPPGQGKTEFYRALNRIDGKPTMVISGRPHLGFEELVATVQILSKDKVTSLGNLADLYGRLDSTSASLNLFQVSREIALKRLEHIDFVDKAQDTNVIKALQIQWLKDVAGLTPKMAEALSNVGLSGETQSAVANSALFRDIQRTFVNHLIQNATKSLLETGESTKYLRGLILTADRLGMRVIIDEAEKIYRGTAGESASFGGLEDILTRQPGSTVHIIGDIEHHFSEDFCIDISMNEPKIPEHAKSRFGMHLYFEANAYDRMAIAAVGIADIEGNIGLSPQAQEKLIFFTAFAWPAIKRAAELAVDQNGEPSTQPFNLRNLQSIISALVHDGRPQNITVAEALSRIPHVAIRETVARFAAFHPQLSLSARLSADPDAFLREYLSASRETLLQEEQSFSPFYKALTHGPEGVETRKQNNIAPLTESEVRKLSKAQPPETRGVSDQTDSLTSRITIIAGDTKEPELSFTSPSSGEKLFSGTVQFQFDSDQPKKNGNITVLSPSTDSSIGIHTASSFGTTVVLRQGEKYCAFDTTGTLSGAIGKERWRAVIRPISFPIENPQDIKLSPNGDHLYYVINGQLFCQPLGIYETDSSIGPVEPFPIAIPGESTLKSVTMSRDGNYALVTCQNDNHYLLDLAATQKTKQSMVITDAPLYGEGWQIDTFQNVVYLFNTQTNKGFRFS